MTAHTDAGALLKLAAQELVDEIAKRGTHNGWKKLDRALQAASQGSAGGEREAIVEMVLANVERRQRGFAARASSIFNGAIIAEELADVVKGLTAALSPPVKTGGGERTPLDLAPAELNTLASEAWAIAARSDAAAGGERSAVQSDEVKLTYIKRWRTIVPLPAKYADEIAEALRAPAQAPPVPAVHIERRDIAKAKHELKTIHETRVLLAREEVRKANEVLASALDIRFRAESAVADIEPCPWKGSK